jgi:hypothetical protein
MHVQCLLGPVTWTSPAILAGQEVHHLPMHPLAENERLPGILLVTVPAQHLPNHSVSGLRQFFVVER